MFCANFRYLPLFPPYPCKREVILSEYSVYHFLKQGIVWENWKKRRNILIYPPDDKHANVVRRRFLLSYTFQKKKQLSRLFLDENIHIYIYIFFFIKFIDALVPIYKTEMYLLYNFFFPLLVCSLRIRP